MNRITSAPFPTSFARASDQAKPAFYGKALGVIDSPLFALFPGRELRDDQFQRGRACSNTGESKRYVSCFTRLHTGEGDLDRVKTFATYLGNTSITIWGPPRPVSRVSTSRGSPLTWNLKRRCHLSVNRPCACATDRSNASVALPSHR